VSLYRRTNQQRQQQMSVIQQTVGQTATWRHYVSASAGAGTLFGATRSYIETTFTGYFGQFFMPSIVERQTPGGQIPAAAFGVITPFKFGVQDEVRYNGAIYRIEGDSQPSTLNAHYVTELKRGSG
jgi:hypothetical protein